MSFVPFVLCRAQVRESVRLQVTQTLSPSLSWIKHMPRKLHTYTCVFISHLLSTHTHTHTHTRAEEENNPHAPKLSFLSSLFMEAYDHWWLSELMGSNHFCVLQSRSQLMLCSVWKLWDMFSEEKIAFKKLHLSKALNQQLLSWSNVYTDLSTFTPCIMLAVPRSLEPSR